MLPKWTIKKSKNGNLDNIMHDTSF